MSAIEASSVGLRTMADGTLRLTIDIEPRFARDAFGLFGAPGTPCALAALRVGAEVSPEPEKPKGGPLAQLAGRWCNDPEFQKWIEPVYQRNVGDIGPEFYPQMKDYARHCVIVICGVESRAELDHDKTAATRFEVEIRLPYMDWLKANGRMTR